MKQSYRIRGILSAVLFLLIPSYQALAVDTKEIDALFSDYNRPPVDGRVVRGEKQVEVGDKIRVRLLSTDTEHGFIDFANI
jgi:hypothetical protein